MLSSEVQELIRNEGWKKITIGKDFKVDIVINSKSKEKIKVRISLTNGDIIEYIGYEVIDYINFEMQFIQYWYMCDGKYKVENNIIVLETELYWKFYKTFNKGKDFLKYNWIINGKECRFMTTKEMFDNNKRGIYGIYYNGELIYIGSVSDYIERWKQHEEEFNSPVNSDGMWIFENIEKLYIELLQPKFNIEGKSKPYVFKTNNFYKEKFDEEKIRKKLRKKLGIE